MFNVGETVTTGEGEGVIKSGPHGTEHEFAVLMLSGDAKGLLKVYSETTLIRANADRNQIALPLGLEALKTVVEDRGGIVSLGGWTVFLVGDDVIEVAPSMAQATKNGWYITTPIPQDWVDRAKRFQDFK